MAVQIVQSEPFFKTITVNEICIILNKLGVPSHVSGYRYLRCALKMVLGDRTVLDNVTERLYGRVAHEFETTPTRVERCIRNAIEKAFDRAEPLFAKIFNLTFGKTRNVEFLSLVADYIESQK